MPINKKLILCVDDHRDSLNFLVEWLRLKGYDVKPALTCDKAIAMVHAHQVALSILDSKLEDGNGFDLCQSILATSPETKIVIYSGDTRPEMERKALAAGAKAFLAKPLDLHYLTELVEELIG